MRRLHLSGENLLQGLVLLGLLGMALRAMPVGAAPFAYVANAGSNTVSVLDTARNTVVAMVPVGVFPNGATITPGGTRAYVTNSHSNTVSVLDTARNTVVATVPVGVFPGGVAITPVVIQPPKITSFTATPTLGAVPLVGVPVAFAVTIADPTKVQSVQWDFHGDGTVDQTTTTLTTQFTYTITGTFNPTVTVLDTDGGEASAATTVTAR